MLAERAIPSEVSGGQGIIGTWRPQARSCPFPPPSLRPMTAATTAGP